MATKRLFTLMDLHCLMQGCGEVHVEKAMTSFPRNDYEPDICFFGIAKASMLTPDTLRFPVPDLIVEVISPSTEARDRGVKFTDYASHGVREYWLVDPMAESAEVHRLAEGAYAAATRETDGMLVSEVIPGLQVPVRAIFDDAVNREVVHALRNLASIS